MIVTTQDVGEFLKSNPLLIEEYYGGPSKKDPFSLFCGDEDFAKYVLNAMFEADQIKRDDQKSRYQF